MAFVIAEFISASRYFHHIKLREILKRVQADNCRTACLAAEFFILRTRIFMDHGKRYLTIDIITDAFHCGPSYPFRIFPRYKR
jgi:hypothetical protein